MWHTKIEKKMRPHQKERFEDAMLWPWRWRKGTLAKEYRWPQDAKRAEERWHPPEAGRDNDSPLEPLEWTWSCQHFDLGPVILVSNSWSLGSWGNKFLLFQAVKFVVIYYNSLTKLIETNILGYSEFPNYFTSVRGLKDCKWYCDLPCFSNTSGVCSSIPRIHIMGLYYKIRLNFVFSLSLVSKDSTLHSLNFFFFQRDPNISYV